MATFNASFFLDDGPPDNTGRHFIFAYLKNLNHPATADLLDVELFVSTSSPNDVSVRVASAPGSSPAIDARFTVTAGACDIYISFDLFNCKL